MKKYRRLVVILILSVLTVLPARAGDLGRVGMLKHDHKIPLTLLLVRLVNLWTFIPISGLVTYAFGFARAFNLNSQGLAPGKPAGANSVPTPIES